MVQEVAGIGQSPIATGKRSKFDRAVYFRRPNVGQYANWLTTGSYTHREAKEARGFEYLRKYGFIPHVDPVLRDDDGNPVPLRDKWYPILAHPDGPAEFPLSQIVTYRWYIAEECPNPDARFPQLGGHKVTHYPCPECDRPPFFALDGLGGVEHLARHLRLMHDWDRPSLMKYGEKVGLDFDVVYGDLKKSYDFTAPATEVGRLTCDECDFVVREDSKNAAASLRFHQQKAHKPLEVETVDLRA